jgi:hypothetical protein
MTGPGSTPALSALPRNEQLFLGGTLLSLICTFFPFDGISVVGTHPTENAWHKIGVLASLLVLVVFLVALAHTFARSSIPQLPVSLNLIEAGGMALAVLFFLIRWLTLGSVLGIDIHLRWGGYLTLIVTIATTAVGVIRMREAGEAMPWENSGDATPPAA